MKPLIGIVANSEHREFVPGIDYEYSYLNSAYAQAIAAAGGIPVLLPASSKAVIEAYSQQLAALVLAGGDDIAPHHYGQEPQVVSKCALASKDESDLAFVHAFQAQKKPILGICRGMQVLNVANGGTLWQDVSQFGVAVDSHLQVTKPLQASEIVTIQPNSHLGQFLPQEYLVNSLHHQAIQELATGFEVVASSPDGLIEAIEHQRLPIIAVQWHPELLAVAGESGMQQLFTYFIQELVMQAPQD
ncbi:MAG: gamma-glutamyl-gamma-aminobutyrate hydrolase family protein [Culicoidibacterales bacterium]